MPATARPAGAGGRDHQAQANRAPEATARCRGFKALKQIVKLQYKLEDHEGMMASYR